jgi:hypothetical protein
MAKCFNCGEITQLFVNDIPVCLKCDVKVTAARLSIFDVIDGHKRKRLGNRIEDGRFVARWSRCWRRSASSYEAVVPRSG